MFKDDRRKQKKAPFLNCNADNREITIRPHEIHISSQFRKLRERGSRIVGRVQKRYTIWKCHSERYLTLLSAWAALSFPLWCSCRGSLLDDSFVSICMPSFQDEMEKCGTIQKRWEILTFPPTGRRLPAGKWRLNFAIRFTFFYCGKLAFLCRLAGGTNEINVTISSPKLNVFGLKLTRKSGVFIDFNFARVKIWS